MFGKTEICFWLPHSGIKKDERLGKSHDDLWKLTRKLVKGVGHCKGNLFKRFENH